tara:strand:+ start:2735 stop:2920 length:186 start_codon:yes stop_codon:yes gene_type:complete
MKSIEFTDQERAGIVQLIDMAVKATGVRIAQPAAILASKFMDDPKPEEEGESEEQDAEYAE